MLLLAGGVVVGELVGGLNAGKSDWEVNGGGIAGTVVSVLRLNGLLGARDTVGLLGAGDTGGCGAATGSSGTSCAASANHSCSTF